MIDPATGAVIGTIGGSLTLINSLIRICQEHQQNPDSTPPNVAQLVAMLPAAALKATGDLIEQIKQFRDECYAAGIDLKLTKAQLQEQAWFYQRGRRRILKMFDARIDRISQEISILFEDIVSVSDCADRLNAVARSFEAARKEKESLRKGTSEDLSVGEILHNLQEHAERARAQLGDLNRKP